MNKIIKNSGKINPETELITYVEEEVEPEVTESENTTKEAPSQTEE